MRAALLLKRDIPPEILFYLINFLVPVSLHALLLLLGVGLGTFALLCLRRAKKKKVEVSETAFRCSCLHCPI